MKAIWKDQIVAASDDTVIVEGNHYFPVSSLNKEFFSSSETRTHCPWKGDASYYSLIIDGDENTDAAWYYAEPKDAAAETKDRVAFRRGVVIVE